MLDKDPEAAKSGDIERSSSEYAEMNYGDSEDTESEENQQDQEADMQERSVKEQDVQHNHSDYKLTRGMCSMCSTSKEISAFSKSQIRKIKNGNLGKHQTCLTGAEAEIEEGRNMKRADAEREILRARNLQRHRDDCERRRHAYERRNNDKVAEKRRGTTSIMLRGCSKTAESAMSCGMDDGPDGDDERDYSQEVYYSQEVFDTDSQRITANGVEPLGCGKYGCRGDWEDCRYL